MPGVLPLLPGVLPVPLGLPVRGVTGLRIADASVLPVQVSGNTAAPAMLVGYRAADLILAER